MTLEFRMKLGDEGQGPRPGASRRSLSLWGQAWAGAPSGRPVGGRPHGGGAGSAWCPRAPSRTRLLRLMGRSLCLFPTSPSLRPLCRPLVPTPSLVAGAFPGQRGHPQTSN